MKIQVSVEISSLPSTVFKYLTNISKLIEWQAFLIEAQQLSSPPVDVGSKFRNILRHPDFDTFGIMTLEVTGEVLIFEFDKRLKIKGHSKVAELIIDYELYQFANHTTLQQTIDLQLLGLQMLPIANLVKGFLTKQFQIDLTNLKLLLESEQNLSQ